MDEERVTTRFKVLRWAVFAIAALLIGRLGYLQLAKGEFYEQAARENRIRVLPIAAPRGQIYDTNGKPLAVNRPSYTVSLVDMGNGSVDQVVAPLAQLLGMKEEEIHKKIEANNNRLFEPIRIANRVSMDVVTKIEERRSDLPGVYVEYVPIREYPNGDLLAHVIGYLSEVSSDDLTTWAKDYKLGDIVGRSGLERSYETILRGKDGGILVEVDSNNQLIRVLGREEPIPGNDIYLTIDIDLQRVAEQNLQSSLQTIRTHQWANSRAPYAYSGAVVAMDPNTGAILAMASYPNYNPNDWASGRLDDESLRIKYLIGSEQYPNAMLNRAVLAALPPGSVFKPVTLAAALEQGVVSTTETVYCNGFYTTVDPDNPSKCWNWDRGGHGTVNSWQALRDSCNVYFYEMGRRLGPERLSNYAKMFGLGEDTGLSDLIYDKESDPYFTHRSDPAFKQWAYSQKLVDTNVWYPGESIYSAIGQQYSAFTPLQMTVVTSTIANRGTRFAPYLVAKVVRGQNVEERAGKQVMGTVELQPSTWQSIHQGMVAVTQYGGTSYSISFGDNPTLMPWRDIPVAVAGKTGTAQVANDPNDIRAHGWFTAYAPAEKPQIAIAMVVEAGRGGSASSAPTVAAMIKQYLGYNQPVASTSTPPAPSQENSTSGILPQVAVQASEQPAAHPSGEGPVQVSTTPPSDPSAQSPSSTPITQSQDQLPQPDPLAQIPNATTNPPPATDPTTPPTQPR